MTRTKTIALLFASAALTAAVGLPAWSAMHGPGPGEGFTRLIASGEEMGRVILADDDEDENEGAGESRRGSDDDEGACEDDDGACGPAAAAPAPAGSVPPPQNGLFDNNAAPQVQVK